VAIPINIGTEKRLTSGATPTPQPASVTVKTGCLTIGISPSTGALAVGTTTVPQVAVRAGGQGPILLVGNPNGGDTIPHGTYLVYGAAFDPSSPNGGGVSEVNFFLEPRDAGGLHLGSTVPGQLGTGQLGAYVARLSIPDNTTGGHTFVAYARSSLTGLESAVSVPVNVGAPPSPTARP